MAFWSCFGSVMPTDLERPDADAIARDAEPHALLRKLVRLEERLQRLGERFGLAQLAADDDPGLEACCATWTSSAEPLFTTRAAASCRRADLEADELLVRGRSLVRLSAGFGARLRLLRLLARLLLGRFAGGLGLTGKREAPLGLGGLAGFSSAAGTSFAALLPRFGRRSLSLISFLKSMI